MVDVFWMIQSNVDSELAWVLESEGLKTVYG